MDGLRGFGESVLSIVPAGFEAYARVYHPAWHVTQETRTALRWSEVAAQAGRVAHREMQWPHIRGEAEMQDHLHLEQESWLEEPEMGNLPLEVARPLWQLLSRHTKTPETCFFGIWEGFGCLDREVLRTPSFETPGRRWHLFHAPIEAIETTFCGSGIASLQGAGVLVLIPHSPDSIPQQEIDQAYREVSWLPPHQSANFWWPDDRAWCVATEIDFVTTYVGGTQEAVTAILESELEAHQVEPADSVTYAGDTVNPTPPGGY